MTSDENEDFEPLVVLQFSTSTPEVTKEWVINRLTASRGEDEGAGLLARFANDVENRSNLLVIGASTKRLLIGAQALKIKKWHKDKGLREFLVSDISHFDNSENPGGILLKSEKQRVIWEEIQNLRPMKNEQGVPGVTTKSFTSENDTILQLLRSLKFIDNVFPLHDKEEIKLLERDWFRSRASIFKSQDIHQIRNYFGENVAFYFAFLEFYTKALIPPSVLAILMSFWPSSDFFKYSLLCFFNVIWWTIFMERWKRQTNILAYQWGSLDLQVFERARPDYYGDLRLSSITGKNERRYPTWRRTVKQYLVTYPIVMICLATSLTVYFNYLRIKKSTDAKYPADQPGLPIQAKILRILPSAGYSLCIIPINLTYKKIATYLTEYENYRLQTSYENSLTAKLFIFFFVNCFIGLFYEAFFNVNYGNVAQLLTSLVIVNAILLKFTEQIGPYVFKHLKTISRAKKGSVDVRINEAVQEAKTLTPFEGTYSDYLTIFEQYGYVALFSAVFPWVTICALINNVFELRADAFKYCYVYQRPFGQRASSIGSWHYAFDILSSVAIVTNTALIAMQPSVREYFSSYTDAEYIILFVAAEHILLALKFAIDFAIPDVPPEVDIARAKLVYESTEALMRERERNGIEAESVSAKF